MNISRFKIFIIFIVFSIGGLFVLPKLYVKLNPTSTLPSITVNFNWANASPYNLEREVTSILETGFSTIKGLQNIESKSSKGSGYITLSFNKHTDINVARFETATKIRELYNQLPEQTDYPSVSVNKNSREEDNAFLSYSIKANTTPFNIQEVVTSQIIPHINGIQGVDKTQVYGANPKEYILSFDISTLKVLEVSKENLIEVLRNQFEKTALGPINFNNNYITLVIDPINNEMLWHLPVKKIENRIIYLDQIATISEKEQETQNYFRINGDNVITLNVFSTKNANTIHLASKIGKTIETIIKNLPKGYSIIKTYDNTEYLRLELTKIYERTSYTIIILLIFVFLISNNVKYLFITLISLFANISIAFLFYYIFEIEIQLYSLAGITISLGLIIDNSIVMIDHIRHQNNKAIFIPILASTLTTIGALSIIFFLDDKSKSNLIDFALVIMINLFVSLLVAFYLIPALLEKIKVPKTREKEIRAKKIFYEIYSNIITIELQFKKLIILFIILVFGLPIFMLPEKLENSNLWYEEAYNNTIGSELYNDEIRPYIDTYLGGSFRLFNKYVYGDSFYSTNEETKLLVIATTDKETTVHQMNVVFLAIENYLKQYDEIKLFKTNINSSNIARLEITFNNLNSESSFPLLLKSSLIRKALDFGGMDWKIYGIGDGYNSGGNTGEPVNFSVKAKGYNYDELNNWADSLKTTLEQHPRIQKVLIRENSYLHTTTSYNYYFSLDKEKLALSKITPSKIVDELQQFTLSKYKDLSLDIQGRYTPIRLESEQSKDFDIWHIKNTLLDSLNKPVILKNLSKIIKEQEEDNIYKKNQEYVRLVEFQYVGSSALGSDFLNKTLKEFVVKLPLGYTFKRTERLISINQENEINYFYIFLLVIGIIYLICAVLFESFKQPFIILSVIPISFIGVFLTFYIFNFNFDQGGLASFVVLSGITVNASIFIINNFNRLKKKFPEQNNLALYIEAFKQKILPIILTISSTILGFIPFIKDGQNEVFWFALGVGTIGGLIFSLIGILFYLPLFTLKKQIN